MKDQAISTSASPSSHVTAFQLSNAFKTSANARRPSGLATPNHCRPQTVRHSRLLAILGAIAVCISASPGFADGKSLSELMDDGRDIAQAHCAPCHAIEKNDTSPTRINENTAFRDLHNRFPISMLEDARESGSIAGHDEMPAFDFSLEEMQALLAYIDSFSPAGAGKYLPAAPDSTR